MTGPMPEVGVRFTPKGLDQVARGLKIVRDQAEPTQRQWGTASRQIASGLESIARQGKVTGESMKQIITNGAEMAFMFGPQGAVVGAIAITGAAIYQHIVGGMKAAQEEAKKTTESINAMIDAGDKAGIYKQMSTVYRGTPSQNFDDGIVGLQTQAAYLESRRLKIDPTDRGHKLQMIATKDQLDLAAAIDRVNAKLTDRLRLFDQLRSAYNAPMPVSYTGQIAGVTTTESNDLPTNRAGDLGRFTAPPIGRFPVGIPKVNAGSIAVRGIGAVAPELTDAERQLQSAAAQIGATFADTLADAIGAGVRKAFEKGLNLASIGKAIIASATASLGNIAVEIGKKALAVALAQSKVAQQIASWGPAGVAAAIALIAVGSAMRGAGGSAGAASGGGYSSAYSASTGYGASIIDRGIIDPNRTITARSGNNYSFTVIGANDPKVQSDILKLIDNAERRGSV